MGKPPDVQRLVDAGLHYLTRFSASVEMVRRVLERRVRKAERDGVMEREAGRTLIDQAMARIAKLGVLNDEAFALGHASAGLRRGKAPGMVARTLAAKGVDAETAEGVLDDIARDNPSLALETAMRLARRKRLGPWRTGARAEFRQRDVAALARAGHPIGIAMTVIDAEDPDALEALLVQD